MVISFAELEEEGEFSLEDATKGIYGLISTELETLAKYFVFWDPSQPSVGVTFDLIIGHVHPLEAWGDRVAVSLVHRGLNGPSFIDAKSRPFAKRQALNCLFPTVDSHADDIAATAFNIVNFVLKHDSRLINCFARRA